MIIDYAVLWFSDASSSLPGIRFMRAVAFSAACSVCHRCLGKGKHLLLNAWWCGEQDGWTDHEIVLGQSYAANPKHSKPKCQVTSFCLFSSALTAKIHFFEVWGFFIPTWNLRFSQNYWYLIKVTWQDEWVWHDSTLQRLETQKSHMEFSTPHG